MTIKRILIIDDDIAHLSSTREILFSEGYEVYTHSEGFGATNACRQLNPDLILLDVNMPGLSGENLLAVLQANPATRDVPVVFYSSNEEDVLRTSVKRLGARGYISKGNITSLRSRVAQFLEPLSSAR
jgi:CheY-like chemotaxis protein